MFDGTLELSTADSALLELLPDPGCGHYRLEAEVSHRAGGRAGLFVGYQQREAEGVRNHYLCRYAFSDQEALPMTHTSQTRHQHGQLESPPLSGDTSGADQTRQFRIRDAGGSVLHRRGEQDSVAKVALEVSPEGISAFWEEQPIGSIPWSELQTAAGELARVKPLDPDGEPTFQARAPLGVLVERGAAAFRNVVVRPVAP